MMAPELMSAEEAARLYLTSRAAELTKQIAVKRNYANSAQREADDYNAEADALRTALQGITAIRARNPRGPVMTARDIVIKSHGEFCDSVCAHLQRAIDSGSITQVQADDAVDNLWDDGLFNAWQEWKGQQS